MDEKLWIKIECVWYGNNECYFKKGIKDGWGLGKGGGILKGRKFGLWKGPLKSLRRKVMFGCGC